jgi:predicted AlkP superfamily phosphohydrolase/phosphomutase
MQKNKNKVLVIGLDGASLRFIESWANEGKLPNFKKMLENGVSASLTSVIPPISAPAWTSFITGKNPGKHGIFGFTDKNGNLVNASHINGKSLWRILSDHGKKVVVISVPMTFPVERVNGILISGYMAPPDNIYTYPPDLAKELSKRFPTFRIYMKESDPLGRDEKAIDAWLKDLYSVTEANAEVMMHYVQNSEWDFLMTVFMGTDWISHVFWRYTDPECLGYDAEMSKKYGGAILQYYQKLDSILKKILDTIDEDVVLLIMSDHGSGPFHGVFNLHKWLIEMGLLKIKNKGPIRIGFWLPKMGMSLEKLIVFLSNHPRLLRLSRWMWNTFQLESLITNSVDWSKTRAYPAVNGVFINLKGREPYGIVEPGKDYENLRNFIIKELLNYRDPASGEKIFNEIFKKENLYVGPYSNQAPDLLFVASAPYLILRGLVIPRQILRSAINFLPAVLQSAKHEIEGTLIAIGSDIVNGRKLGGARIIDLAPTILHILDVPIPSDMDGRPLKELFKQDSYLASGCVEYQAPEAERKEEYPLTEEEEEKIKKRLRALGYLD